MASQKKSQWQHAEANVYAEHAEAFTLSMPKRLR
jgi:hypothetical protein